MTYQAPELVPPPEPDITPGDCWDGCVHNGACLMQWERTYHRGALTTDEVAARLGCGEGCECYEEGKVVPRG